jgi:hypothetical protein
MWLRVGGRLPRTGTSGAPMKTYIDGRRELHLSVTAVLLALVSGANAQIRFARTVTVDNLRFDPNGFAHAGFTFAGRGKACQQLCSITDDTDGVAAATCKAIYSTLLMAHACGRGLMLFFLPPQHAMLGPSMATPEVDGLSMRANVAQASSSWPRDRHSLVRTRRVHLKNTWPAGQVAAPASRTICAYLSNMLLRPRYQRSNRAQCNRCRLDSIDA